MSPLDALVMIAAAVTTAVLIFVLLRNRAPAARPTAVRILAEHVVNKVSTHDADGTFRYVSPVFAGLLGEYPGALVGKHPRDFVHPDDAQALAGLWKRALQWSGTPTTAIWRCRRHDGEYAWLEMTARATTQELAELGAIVCGSRDVTERKLIEDALRDSEQRFRTTLETVRLVAVALDRGGRITFANDALCALTGWPRSELIGENWFDRCVPTGHPMRATFYEHIESGNIPPQYEHEIVARDGRRRTIEWDTTVMRTQAGEVVGTASLGADVTDRRQEEATLKLLQSITLAISAASDLDSALQLTLESLCGATGWGYGEAWLPSADGTWLERSCHFAAVGVDAGALVASGRVLSFRPGEGLCGRAWESKSAVWVPDIAEFPSKVLASTAVQCGFRAAVALPVIADDVVAVLDFFMDRPRATDVRHAQMLEVVANQVGAVIERRRAQKQHEADLLRARDEAQAASHAKSDFLSRMSHELRTPLNSVIGFANVLRKNKSGLLAQEEITFLDRIAANGQHLLQLVNDVLDIAKVEAGRLTVTSGIVAVDQLVRDVVAQLEGQPRSPGVELRAEVPDDMTPIQSDGILLRQVLINLAGNALRFTHEGSVVVAAEADATTGQPLRIHVRDTGIGISPERQEAIFEPFEQADIMTHRTYGGTGLGLSISKAICDALGYALTLASDVGEGSTFTVHLVGGNRKSERGNAPAESVSKNDHGVPIPDNSAAMKGGARNTETQRR